MPEQLQIRKIPDNGQSSRCRGFAGLISNKVLVLFLLIQCTAFAQNTLYDDSRLSSVHISIHPDSLRVLYDSVLSDHYYMTRFIFDDGINRDTLEKVGFRLRGNTSRFSQKKSFKISFNEYVPGREYQDVRKINLNGEHNDPSMIREKLYYELWKKAGMPERRTAFVRLFINDAYYGLYTNLEEMDKTWVGRVFEKKGGNLYKCTYPADLVYRGEDPEIYKNLENSTATGGRVYDLETNKTEDDYTRLADLISTLHIAANSVFEQEIVKILDVESYLMALALDVATGNWDDYSFNRNNYYLYDNPGDSLFSFITYDPDNTFGIDWFGIDWAVRDCRSWINNGLQLPLAQKTLKVSSFYSRYKVLLDTVARFIINPDSVFPRINAMKELIQQSAEEDFFRTLDYGYTLDDFNNSFIMAIDDHTPYGIKPFLTMRKNTILNQLNPTGMEDDNEQYPLVTIFPNPASDQIQIAVGNQSFSQAAIRIYDLMGTERYEIRPEVRPAGLITIGTRDLPPGLYVVVIRTPGNSYTGKFIRQ